MKPSAILISLAVLILILVGAMTRLYGIGWFVATSRVAGPNVILINIDTLRADHLSQYGYRDPTSRILEEFASHSTRFASAHAPAPWTKPSVASLMSGLAPARHGATDRSKPLSLDATTFAELLQKEGWRTGAFSDNPFVSSATQLDQGFDFFHYQRKTARGAKAQPHSVNSHETRLYDHAEEMFQKAAGWIMQEKNRRFLLYLQPMNVHGPYKVPAAAQKALLGRRPLEGFRYYEGLMQDIMMKRQFDRRAAVDQNYLRSQREMYDTSIHYTAGVIAGFFAFLQEQGLYDDALIIVTSDHGEEMFEHGGFGHAWTLYQEVLAVPLFVKLPQQTEGQVIERSVSLLDIFPTILEATGIDSPEDLEGRPLQSYMEPNADSVDRALYFSTGWPRRCIARGVREGPWKLILIKRSYDTPESTLMLYNLDEDPSEAHNVADEHPEVVARLEAKTDQRFAFYKSHRMRIVTSENADLDEDALRALGYVE